MKRGGLCFDDVRLRVPQSNALAQFVRSEAFFPIPAKESVKKLTFFTDPFAYDYL